MEIELAARLQERADRGDISHEAVQKITHDNGKVFYGL
jgi:hypothetical protein